MDTVFSFDVFDTCLTRIHARPTDVFAAAARRLWADRPEPFPEAEVHDIVRLRTVAETQARRNLVDREDLSLDAICACLPVPNRWGITAEALYRAELTAEAACLRPVEAVRAAVRALRAQGRRIVFVTDMYLPGDFIREQLAAHGFYRDGDGLYVSGEVGLCKWSGRLFRHVLAREGVAAGALCHVGDNPVSDVRVPRRLGIRARLSTASRLAPREARLARPLPGFDPAASLLAGAARTVRCATGPQPDALCDLAADVAAPVFLAFTAWVLTEAARAGIERLHFVSRDGQILYRLARTLRRVWPELPEPHYIHGSRQAWFLPAVGRCTREALDWLFVPGHCRRPEVLLAKLDLTPSDLPDPGPAGAARAAFWSRELPPGREGDFWDLLERPANARCVEAKARQARELAARYFADRTKGLSAFAVVDLGWTLKTQAALETVFRESGLDVPLCGYYFGVSAARSDGLAGRYRAFLVESTRHLDPAETLNPLFRNVNLLEQCFALADHGQVTGYRLVDGQSVADLRPAAPGQLALAGRVQGAIVAVAEAWAGEAAASRLGPASLVALTPAVVANLVDFLAHPRPGEAAALGQVLVGDDQNETRYRRLVRPLGPGDLLRAWLSLRGWRSWPAYEASCDWLEGGIALSRPWLRPILRTRRAFALLRDWRKSC